MLKPIRRHRKGCPRYGQPGTKECPSALKNKCPLVVHYYVHRKRRERSLNTNDLKVAWELAGNMVLEGKNEPENAPKTVAEAIDSWLESEKSRGIRDSTLKSFRKFLKGNPKRKDDPNYSLTLLDFAKQKEIVYLRDFTPELCDKPGRNGS
jgi:hypothetical protein